MIQRRAFYIVKEALNRQAAVALIGPRQIGKTTLALAISAETPSLYLDLESLEDRAKLVDPAFFLRNYEDRLVVLDEIHRVPELFQTLRGLIDEGRRHGRRNGRFLILGSASMDLLHQSSESLAGRIAYVNMGPLDVLEITTNSHDLITLWNRGGFPDSYLAEDDNQSLLWRKDFIRSYLERDVQLFGPRVPAETLERLWTMLAHSQGTILNASRLAAALMISAQTATRYIDLLVDLLLIRRLRPFNKNVGKRLVKSPKVYIRDSGIVHALLGIKNYNELAGHPVVGASWEGFAIENLLATVPLNTTASFYRTAAGAEIDLALEIPGYGLWAIEIKQGLSPKAGKGFYLACEDLKPDKCFIVYSGEERYPISENIEVISLQDLAKTLSSL
ncbi:MAG: ATP-binding protein [Thermodesulfobium sp.]